MSVLGFGRVIGSSYGGLVRNNIWFGDGSDGVGVISSRAEIPVEEDVGHILLQYKTLRINSGGILVPDSRCAGMTILVQGDCVINGTINLDKMAPRLSSDTETAIQTTGPDAHIVSLSSGSTGGNGGSGKGSTSTNGGDGGNGFWCGGGYGGGGASSYTKVVTGDWTAMNTSVNQLPAGGDSEPRPPVSINWPPTSGYGAGGRYNSQSPNGNGPGGGGFYENIRTEYTYYNGVDSTEGYTRSDSGSENTVSGADGDAYGGGALWLVVGGTLTMSGTITAKGGNGGRGYCGGGGGGGGLVVLLARKGLYRNGTVTLTGGTGGNGRSASGNVSSRNGSNGSAGTLLTGRIALDGTVTWDA